jgi:hypothetical protein
MQRILTICLLMLSINTFGQMLMIGPKAGVNFSTQTGSQYEVPAINFMYGAVLKYEITRYLEVQGEVLISKKGYREEYQGSEIFDELTATYLEIPAMAKYVYNTNLFNYYAGGGAYWAYWTKGQYKSSVDGTETIYEDYKFINETDADGYKDIRSDFGLVGELGFSYDDFGSGILMLGLRYSYGLTPTNELDPAPDSFVPRQNKVLTISLTYLLFL